MTTKTTPAKDDLRVEHPDIEAREAEGKAARKRVPRGRLLRAVALIPARIRHGRPLRLLLRLLVAGVLVPAAAHAGAGGPAVAGAVMGLAVWLALTMRSDLAPPPGR